MNVEIKTEILISQILERIDFLDVLILKKFYATGKEFPNDTQPYCLPILYRELTEQNNVKISLEGLRKRLNSLVKIGLLNKIERTNPSIFYPVRGKEELVRKIIVKFFERFGFENFLLKI
jgi:predicted transcriptional regulator with HTH domain